MWYKSLPTLLKYACSHAPIQTNSPMSSNFRTHNHKIKHVIRVKPLFPCECRILKYILHNIFIHFLNIYRIFKFKLKFSTVCSLLFNLETLALVGSFLQRNASSTKPKIVLNILLLLLFALIFFICSLFLFFWIRVMCVLVCKCRVVWKKLDRGAKRGMTEFHIKKNNEFKMRVGKTWNKICFLWLKIFYSIKNDFTVFSWAVAVGSKGGSMVPGAMWATAVAMWDVASSMSDDVVSMCEAQVICGLLHPLFVTHILCVGSWWRHVTSHHQTFERRNVHVISFESRLN